LVGPETYKEVAEALPRTEEAKFAVLALREPTFHVPAVPEVTVMEEAFKAVVVTLVKVALVPIRLDMDVSPVRETEPVAVREKAVRPPRKYAGMVEVLPWAKTCWRVGVDTEAGQFTPLWRHTFEPFTWMLEAKIWEPEADVKASAVVVTPVKVAVVAERPWSDVAPRTERLPPTVRPFETVAVPRLAVVRVPLVAWKLVAKKLVLVVLVPVALVQTRLVTVRLVGVKFATEMLVKVAFVAYRSPAAKVVMVEELAWKLVV
jgi:hypothetical protein